MRLTVSSIQPKFMLRRMLAKQISRKLLKVKRELAQAEAEVEHQETELESEPQTVQVIEYRFERQMVI